MPFKNSPFQSLASYGENIDLLQLIQQSFLKTIYFLRYALRNLDTITQQYAMLWRYANFAKATNLLITRFYCSYSYTDSIKMSYSINPAIRYSGNLRSLSTYYIYNLYRASINRGKSAPFHGSNILIAPTRKNVAVPARKFTSC